MPMTDVDSNDALRANAAGDRAKEAAVEALIRLFGGRFARPGNPWIQHEDGAWWVEWEQITDEATGALSGGERRVLAILQDLAIGPLSQLNGGVDHGVAAILLSAIEHAAGAGTPTTTIVADGRFETITRPQHYPWPEGK